MPQWDRLAWGGYVRRKIDVDDNPIVRENQNPICGNHQCEVKFTDGEVTELTANVVSEQIYAQCDEDRNDMLLINYFVGYLNTERVLSLQDQQLTLNGKPCMKSITVAWEICVMWKGESTN